MRIKVKHETTFTYSQPVWLQPHVFRLSPRLDGALRLLERQFRVEPEPVQLSPCLDAEGNAVMHAWFSGTTDHLTVFSAFEVETLRANPYDYLLGRSADRLPVKYDDGSSTVLAGYRMRQYDDEAVPAFATELAAGVGSGTLDFLSALNQRIEESCPRIVREEGPPYPPEQTLALRTGSCRDVALLFVEACRTVGLAARFVSGYQGGSMDDQTPRYMHAWAEVFLPGGGWRGYDPTHGVAIADYHVAVAASRESPDATPIQGAFQGTGAKSRMKAVIEVQ
ncbi:MAG TPA: transglutaminase family protein [Chthoniobacterales bacterium]